MTEPTDVIQTPRLTLAPPALADFEDYAGLWADLAVVRHMGGVPFSRSTAWARFQRQAGGWALRGFGSWVVRERISGRFVGEVGFQDFKRDITPALGPEPEAGWMLAPWAHGQGLASEAVAAAHAWGDARFDGPRTVCMIDPNNAPSLRLAAKMGYAEYARAAHGERSVVLLERPAPARQDR
ncbi:MAG TPA: GNAT family N-acetyltransferase [Caulobacteraceae bacterium]|nr:GNAT family N-acetyltransferase [Caulobacteraceae bacterium]